MNLKFWRGYATVPKPEAGLTPQPQNLQEVQLRKWSWVKTLARMNPHTLTLFHVNPNSKESYLGIGLMSGTSLDGLDVALCRFFAEESRKPELIYFNTYSWPAELKQLLRECTSVETVSLKKLTYLNRKGAEFFAESVLTCIQQANYLPEHIDFIGSHGHTIYHIPSNYSPDGRAATLQLIDADHIAEKTGILIISDFRQKHIAAGGEGAPLVVYGDFALYADPNENRFLVNIGGMANLTWLPQNGQIDDVRTTDTGPGNKLIDCAVNLFDSTLFFDAGGNLAKKGQIHQQTLEALLRDPFFSKGYPKSTGTEYFNSDWLLRYTSDLSHYDRIRTITRLTALSITNACAYFSSQLTYNVYISGGGIHNSVLMEDLRELLGNDKVKPFNELGIPADAKESVLFAWLAFQTYLGKPIKSPKNTGIIKKKLFGKISLPL